MAKNMIFKDGDQITLPVISGTVSGDPVVSQGLNGVALQNRQTDGNATVRTKGVFNLSVAAIDAGGDTAINDGDMLYFTASATPKINADTSGTPYGVAQADVAVGATASINVALIQPGISESGGRGTREFFEVNPVTSALAGGAASGTGGAVNIMNFGSNNFEYSPLGTQTILAPVISATGLNVGMDQTDNDGVQITRGITARNPEAFVVGTDAFWFKCNLTIPVVAGTDDCALGLRIAAAYAALDDFTDFACLNVISGDIFIESDINNAGTTTTDTTDNLADATKVELAFYVDIAGAITYTIDGVAPTTTAAESFIVGDTIIPFFYFLHANASQAGAVTLSDWESGLQ